MISTKRQNQRGIAIYVSCVLMVIAIPMMGLAIDTTVLYVVKSRLQGAVDGAALAATKALAHGTDDGTQIANAKAAAATYVMLNYPANYFFTTNVTVSQATDVTVDESVQHQRTVNVTAHVAVPTLFMRWLSFTSANVNAIASTVRRDVNIAMVVDRSGSLAASGSCDAVKQAAINFVDKFSDGRDNIALVTFAASTHVDFPIANNFKTAATPVSTMLGNIVCAGSTSSAMGLWMGYDELVNLNQTAALNVILFFTDGKPTGVNVNMPLVAATTCTNGHAGPPQWINGLYNTYTNADQFFGILQPTNTGTVTNGDNNATTDASSGAGCQYMTGWPGSQTTLTDFQGVPQTDVFGSNLNNGYQPITLNGTYISLANSANASAMPMNAADDAARQIRNGTAVCANAPGPTSGCTSLLTHAGSMNGVIIYSIGLMNAAYPASTELLLRISNDPGITTSPGFDSSKTAGAFYAAPGSADIDAAFLKVAAEILRLSK
jgi:Flp pilus assembly protein TadG